MTPKNYKYILWDFDGTVMDTAPGIIASAKYALSCFGINEEREEVLRSFIGPPLRVSFPAVCGSDEKMTQELIKKYREFYHAGAMYECVLFDGIKEAVSCFRHAGYKQYIATSKPGHTCCEILEKKGCLDMFDGVFGSTEDGRIDSKLQVLEEAFRVLDDYDRNDYVLIGDTKFDAQGAAQANIDCVCVTYGTGKREELEENGAVVFDTVKEVVNFIMKEKEYKFYGAEDALCAPVNPKYIGKLENPRQMYDFMKDIWCVESCAPRLRGEWSKENMTLGQCSITAFLVQDIFGGKVFGISRPGGSVHCYNEAGGCTFDLTSEQFGDEKLCFENNEEQFREDHFSDADKKSRYEYLKRELDKALFG